MNKYNQHLKKELQEGDAAFFFSCFELIKEDKLALNRNNGEML